MFWHSPFVGLFSSHRKSSTGGVVFAIVLKQKKTPSCKRHNGYAQLKSNRHSSCISKQIRSPPIRDRQRHHAGGNSWPYSGTRNMDFQTNECFADDETCVSTSGIKKCGDRKTHTVHSVVPRWCNAEHVDGRAASERSSIDSRRN